MQVLLWITVLWISYAASLIARGLVHLSFAQFYGLKVRTLWFGYRKAWKTWNWNTVTIGLASWPTWAQIGIIPDRTAGERWLLRLTGGIAWFMNAAVVLALWPPNFWDQTIAGKGPIFLGGPLTGAVFLANLMLCAVGLSSPSHYEVNPAAPLNEGLDAKAQKLRDVVNSYARAGAGLVERGKPASAAQWIRRSLRIPELRGNLDYLAWVASFISAYGDASYAVELYRKILAESERPYLDRWREACDGFASTVIYNEFRRFLPEALSIIDEAIDEFPDSITLYGTRGGVHFDLGNYDEAARDLKRCNEKSSSALDRGISSAFLAAIAARSGDAAAAQAHAKTASELAGDHVVVKRVLASTGLRDTSTPTRA